MCNVQSPAELKIDKGVSGAHHAGETNVTGLNVPALSDRASAERAS